MVKQRLIVEKLGPSPQKLGLTVEKFRLTVEKLAPSPQKLGPTVEKFGPTVEKLGLSPRLFKYNLTVETFQSRLTALDAVNVLHKKYETAKGLTQVATRDRDNLFRKFSKEWRDFRDICKIAYADEENPEYQELVGIKSYSPGYEKSSDEGSDTPVPPTPRAPTVSTDTTTK